MIKLRNHRKYLFGKQTSRENKVTSKKHVVQKASVNLSAIMFSLFRQTNKCFPESSNSAVFENNFPPAKGKKEFGQNPGIFK